MTALMMETAGQPASRTTERSGQRIHTTLRSLTRKPIDDFKYAAIRHAFVIFPSFCVRCLVPLFFDFGLHVVI